MEIFDAEPRFGHERVLFVSDRDSGLRAIIAVHDTTLGPAAGGCRMWPYASQEEALADALRLSTAMTWKNALAGLPLGGGKSVIIGDSRTDKTPELLHAFGDAVQSLGGKYWTAEDVGTGVAAMRTIAERSDYVFGLAFDPSPWTAVGAFEAIKACVEHRLRATTLEGVRAAVQGVGHVGAALVGHLSNAGAHCLVADVNPDAVEAVVADHGAEAVDVEKIYEVDCDIFAPCALGGTVNHETIERIQAGIVCGVANNQLADRSVGVALHERGVTYAPDFVANSGGMLAAGGAILGRVDESDDVIRARVVGIHDRVTAILDRSRSEGRPTAEIADAMAREVVLAARP
jgi:leucine dehydrogenase